MHRHFHPFCLHCIHYGHPKKHRHFIYVSFQIQQMAVILSLTNASSCHAQWNPATTESFISLRYCTPLHISITMFGQNVLAPKHQLMKASTTDTFIYFRNCKCAAIPPMKSSSMTFRQIWRWSYPPIAMVSSPHSSILQTTMSSDFAKRFRPSTLGKIWWYLALNSNAHHGCDRKLHESDWVGSVCSFAFFILPSVSF